MADISKIKLPDGNTYNIKDTSATDTTYTLTQDSSDGHKITLTPSSGTAQTVTVPDNNTTYSFANGSDSFSVTPSGGSSQTVKVSAYKLNSSDTRNDNQLPSWYMSTYPKTTVEEFKTCSAIGVNSIISGTYCVLITTTPWTDNSGGRPVQIALSDSGVRAQRVATADSTWGSWIALPNQNTNTTYTFANGTNGFTVTPSGGSAQTVSVTPSITNNVTGSGTSGCIVKFNGTNTVTDGPTFGSDEHRFLRNDGQWSYPLDPKVATGFDLEMPVTFIGSNQTSGTYYGQLGFSGNLVFNPDHVTTGPFANEYAYLKLSDSNPNHSGITIRSDGIVDCGTIVCGSIVAQGTIFSPYGLYGGSDAIEFPHKYSTDEQIVGYWIDGRPIYEKTVILSSAKSLSPNANTTIMAWSGGTIYPVSFTGYRTSSGPIAWEGVSATYQNGNLIGVSTRDTAISLESFTIQYYKPT
jgi:hypothetical protein